MHQFKAVSEANAAIGSFALPANFTNPDDFDQKFKGLNEAATVTKDAAVKDGDALKTIMATLGGACGSCHKAYRQPES